MSEMVSGLSAELRMSNEDRALVASLRAREADHDQVCGAAADLIERLAPVPVIDGFGVGAWASEAKQRAADVVAITGACQAQQAQVQAALTPKRAWWQFW